MISRLQFPGVLPSKDVISRIKSESDTVILSFSGGKDSIVAWFALREAGLRVVPYFLEQVPGLRFVRSAIEHYERFFGTRIYILPHPALYRWLNNCIFQPPDRWPIIQSLDLPNFDFDDCKELVREAAGLPEGTWTASGVRAVDNLQRQMMFKTHGPINENRRMFYPVWDWKIAEVYGRIKTEGCGLPIDYAMFGRSFDGIHFQYLYPIKQRFPEDYARILEWFPLAELEIKRYEYAEAEKARG